MNPAVVIGIVICGLIAFCGSIVAVIMIREKIAHARYLRRMRNLTK